MVFKLKGRNKTISISRYGTIWKKTSKDPQDITMSESGEATGHNINTEKLVVFLYTNKK